MKKQSIIAAALVMFCFTTAPLWAQRSGGQRAGDDEPASEINEESFHQRVNRDLAAWRHDDARALMEEHQETYGKSTGYEVAWALLLAQERELDEAVSKLDTATKNDSLDPSAPYYLGEIRSWQKEKDPANEAWKQARDRAEAILEGVAEGEEDGWALYWHGAALIRLGKYSQAEAQLKKALTNDTDQAMTEFQLGLALMYQKKWLSSREAFDRCLEADSAFSHAYYFRGRVWQQLGKTEEMLLDMDRFLQLAPDAREAGAARSILRAGG